jgi:hypothetical protein
MLKAESDKKLPMHTLRHRSIKAVIWKNQTDKGVMHNVTITRSYRDQESGQWHDTHSIGYDDLMNVAALMYEAHGYISNLKAKEAKRSKPAAKSVGK